MINAEIDIWKITIKVFTGLSLLFFVFETFLIFLQTVFSAGTLPNICRVKFQFQLRIVIFGIFFG